MSDRIYKVNELLKEEVGRILLKEISPEDGVLTVTAVETTNDLRQSTVWLGYFGQSRDEVTELLDAKSKDVQRQINRRLNLKHVPKLEYRFDQSGDYADSINRIFRNLD